MAQDEGHDGYAGDRDEGDHLTMNHHLRHHATKVPTIHPTNHPPVQQLYQQGVQSDPSKYRLRLTKEPGDL